MTTFIYALLDPITKEVRYVGKADKPSKRFRRHLRENSTEATHKARWIKVLLDNGLRPLLEVIDEVLQSEWKAAEAAYISFYKEEGCNLVNGSPGGDGFGSREDNPNFGKTLSASTRAKLSLARKGFRPSDQTRIIMSNSQRGRRHSAETLSKMSEAQKRRKPPSAETRCRISEGQKRKKPPSSETCKKLSAALKGRILSVAWRAKISAALRGKPKSPQHRANLCGLHHSAETRAKISAARKGKKHPSKGFAI